MAAAHPTSVAVVDDDYRVLEAIGDLLESAGHCVRVFSSGESLLADEALLVVDCLVADIALKGLDGFELRRRARQVRPNLPVIFITARDDIADERFAAAAGHHGFFRKPFDANALLAAVARALGDIRYEH